MGGIQTILCGRTDDRVHAGIHLVTQHCVRKDTPCDLRAVERPLGGHNLRPKELHIGVKDGLIWPREFMGDRICIHNTCATVLQYLADRGFSAGDAARQSDDPHVLLCLRPVLPTMHIDGKRHSQLRRPTHRRAQELRDRLHLLCRDL